MSKELLKSINGKLEVITALLLHLKLQSSEKPSLRKQIETLSSLGVEPKDIANILGRKRTFINKELYKIRKSRKVKK